VFVIVIAVAGVFVIVTAVAGVFVIVIAVAGMFVIMTAIAGMIMLMPTAAMLFSRAFPVGDHNTGFHSTGDCLQLINKTVRIGGGEVELSGGEHNGGGLHLRQSVELFFDLGGAVGAVQILYGVYLLRHKRASFINLHLSNRSYVFSIAEIPPVVNRK
jgi:hypothetical protein